MITSNPYNLPDKILKSNHSVQPIALQNKKSRDRSHEYSKQLSSKGIKIESQMKKSIHLQHITSSPNLHTPSTYSSNRQIDSQNLPRPIEYHQTHSAQINESQHDKRIKFLFQKFYQIHQQLNLHDSIINKLMLGKEKLERSSLDSHLQLNSLTQRESQQKDDMIRNQGKILQMRQEKGQTHVIMNGMEKSQSIYEIEELKKAVTTLKQQISTIRIGISRQKQQQNSQIGTSKSIKFNGNIQIQQKLFERKYQEDIGRIYQSLEQLKLSTQDRFNKYEKILVKFEENNQLLGHKINKVQQRIDNLDSNIQNHMKLVNQEVNNALAKIASSINQKIYKALENNLVIVNEKLKQNFELCKEFIKNSKENQLTFNTNHSEGKTILSKGHIIKPSGFKTDSNLTKIKIQSILLFLNTNIQRNLPNGKHNFKGEQSPSTGSTTTEEIPLGSNIYYIDPEGYLLDENKIYLLDQNNNLLQLETDKLSRIKGIV